MAEDTKTLLRGLSIDRGVAFEDSSARMPWGMLIAALLAGALVAGGAVWFLRPKPAPVIVAADNPDPDDVASAKTSATAPAGNLIASGYVVARRQATVAAQITGQVVMVDVEEGQRVAKGQILARLDSEAAQAAFNNAQAQVGSAQAAINSITSDLADARRILVRTQSLAKSEFASTADLTRNATRVTTLEAQLNQARANLEAARAGARSAAVTLERHIIRAPFSGVVVDKNAQPGEMISPISAGGGFTRTGICTIVDMDSLEIEVDVNEAFIGRVTAGQKVEAVLDAYPDWTIPASVIATVPTANRDKATVKVRIAIGSKDPRILPEMAVKVTFIDKAKS